MSTLHLLSQPQIQGEDDTPLHFVSPHTEKNAGEATDGIDPASYPELWRHLIPDTRGVYALHVQGDRLQEAQVRDGDVVILQQMPAVQNGELAQVWIESDGNTTLGRYYREDNRVCLRAEDGESSRRYFPAHDVHVQGKVLLIIRRLDERLAA